MPYTGKQERLFRAAENDPEIAREHGMSSREAGKLADEAAKLRKEGKEKKASFVDLTRVFGKG